MGVVMRYANAKPSPESWQTAVLGPFRKLIISARTEPLPGPVFGVASFEELQTVLQEFRDFASEWGKLKRGDHAGARRLMRQLDERSRLQITGYILDRRTGRLVPRFDTETSSFREMLYSHLALALQEVPPRCIRQCIACENIFIVASGQPAKYCSGRCQIRVAMRRYRRSKKAKARKKRER